MSRAAALRGAPPNRAHLGDRPVWALEGRDWPERRWSLFPQAAGVRWHVQQYGQGADLLLLHGTAAATHSWRGLGPRLAQAYRVTAIDLPGHGFSDPPPRPDGFTQTGMAAAVGALLRQLDIAPEVVIGHSAGAALGAALCLDGWVHPRRLVALNGALSPHHAFSGGVFSALAHLASLGPAAQLLSWRASTAQVERVIRSTGSALDAEGVELYRRLFARPGHVSAAFSLMANWSRASALGRLHRLTIPLTLVTAEGDTAISPTEAEATRRRLPSSTVLRVDQGGHLVHEEAPDAVARLLLRHLEETGPAGPWSPPS